MVTKKLKAKRTPRKPVRRKKVKRWKVNPWLVAAGLFVLACLVFFPYYRSGRLASSGARIPDGAREFCLDVSHYNEGIVWDSLLVMVDNRGNTIKDLLRAKRILPVTRVVIKATEGERMSDSRFDAYWEEAGAHPLTRGAYHFFRSSKDPVKQAAHYIRHVRLRHSDLPPILDVETMHPGCSKEELNRKVLLWLQTVEKHYGRTPIVYASDSYARDILSPEITRHYPMCIARYNEQPPRFEPWTMWQFTDKALIYGAPGYVDLSVIQ